MDSSHTLAQYKMHRQFNWRTEESEMNNSVIGLDIAKHIFHLFSLGADGKSIKKKLKRSELLAFFANYPVSLIGIEACGGAHHWARELIKLGHEVILLNARYVKSFVVGNRNDFNDAAAIYDAVTRPNKRVVAIKTIAQQDIQLVHSMRKELVDNAPHWSTKHEAC